MDIYERLQLDAARKRDAAYLVARKEYRAALRNINELKRKLGNAEPQKPRKTLIEIIEEVLPRDATFTVAEAVEMMGSAYPHRLFHDGGVRVFFRHMVKRGVLRKV